MRLIDAEWLLSLYEYIDTTDFKKRANVPLDVVIQNIKDAPTIEPSGDLISREDVINALADEYMYEAYEHADASKHKEDYIELAREFLEDIPSADRPQGEDWDKYSEKLWKLAYKRGQADRPKGEWIADEHRNEIECSVCGERHSYGSEPIDEKFYPPFCQWCGADMRSGE